MILPQCLNHKMPKHLGNEGVGKILITSMRYPGHSVVADWVRTSRAQSKTALSGRDQDHKISGCSCMKVGTKSAISVLA